MNSNAGKSSNTIYSLSITQKDHGTFSKAQVLAYVVSHVIGNRRRARIPPTFIISDYVCVSILKKMSFLLYVQGNKLGHIETGDFELILIQPMFFI